jgi:hypothetical protein
MLQDYLDYIFLKTLLLHVYFWHNIGNALQIPGKYVNEGTIGDLGIVCGN